MAGPFGTWSAPGCAFKVEYSLPVLESIRQHILEGFYSMPRGGAEVGGVLLGSCSDGVVRVMARRTAPCEHAFGPAFILSPRDEAAWGQLLAALEGSHEPKVLGWYHSHTRDGICLTASDLALHQKYFPEPWQVALVVQPDHMGFTRAGFFFREADGSIYAAESRAEFYFQPRPDLKGTESPARAVAGPSTAPPVRQAARAAQAGSLGSASPVPQGTAARQNQAGAPAGKILNPETPSAAPLPAFLMPVPQSESARRWPWILVLVISLILAGALSSYEQVEAWWAGPPVDLRVERTASETQIRWNSDARSVSDATGGALQIEDGTSSSVINLDRERLLGGGVSYQPQTQDFEVRLILRQADGRTAVEFATR